MNSKKNWIKLKIKLRILIFIIAQKSKEIDYNGDDVR